MDIVYVVVGVYASDEGAFEHIVSAYADKTTAQNIADTLDELAHVVMVRDGENVANKLMAELVPEYDLPQSRYGVNCGTDYYVREIKVNK